MAIALAGYLRENFQESAKERGERLRQVREMRGDQWLGRRYVILPPPPPPALSLPQTQERERALTRIEKGNALFDAWDCDCSGLIEAGEVELVVGRWRESTGATDNGGWDRGGLLSNNVITFIYIHLIM